MDNDKQPLPEWSLRNSVSREEGKEDKRKSKRGLRKKACIVYHPIEKWKGEVIMA